MTGGFDPALLAGKRVLITGGGTGLGRAMALRFAELGAHLVICGRRAEPLAQTAADVRAQGSVIETERCDIRDAAAVDAMMTRIFARAPLDALVNNAAGNFLAQTHTLSPRAFDSVLNIVLHGSAYCTLGVGRRWIAAKRPGVVLSILTLSALHGAAFTVPSAMAKAGLDAMTKSLAVEWGPHGVRLVAIAPGNFPTEGASARLTPQGKAQGKAEGKAEGAQDVGVPLRRDGAHRELADLGAFLLSDLAGYITGETIVIDGGKRWLGGARTGAAALLDWTDEDWARQRAASG